MCLNAPGISRDDFVALIDACAQPLVLQDELSAGKGFPEKGASYLKVLIYRLEMGVSFSRG